MGQRLAGYSLHPFGRRIVNILPRLCCEISRISLSYLPIRLHHSQILSNTSFQHTLLLLNLSFIGIDKLVDSHA